MGLSAEVGVEGGGCPRFWVDVAALLLDEALEVGGCLSCPWLGVSPEGSCESS